MWLKKIKNFKQKSNDNEIMFYIKIPIHRKSNVVAIGGALLVKLDLNFLHTALDTASKRVLGVPTRLYIFQLLLLIE